MMNDEVQASYNSSFITPRSSINSYPAHPVHPCEFLSPAGRGLARQLRVEHRGLVDEGGHDGRGLLHVVRLYALEGVLRRVVSARVVLHFVLYELEAGQP